MCFASLHVPNRKATSKEKLVVSKIPNMGGYKGTYPMNGADKTQLVCIVGSPQAVVLQVKFEKGAVAAPVVKLYEGKRNVEVTMYNRHHNMWIQFPGGEQVALPAIAEGVRINIGVPVPAPRKRKPKAITGEPGMKVIEQSLVEQKKLPKPVKGKTETV